MWISFLILAAIGLAIPNAQAQSTSPSSGTPAEISSYSLRASDLMGKPVRNPQNERLGTIEDVVIAGEDRMPYAVIALGSFPGASGRVVAVPFRSLVASGQEAYVLDATPEQVKAYPEYKWRRGPQSAAAGSSREDYAAAGKARMSEWEGKVGDFADETKRKTEAGAAEAAARISDAWSKVKEQWRSLGETSGEKWETAKRSFEQSWQEFQREWNSSKK
jgi:hypothetical protein